MTTYTVISGQNLPDQPTSSGDIINVLSGGTLTSASIVAGATANISAGGVDSGSTIAAGGAEFVFGSAYGDIVAGAQTVSSSTTAGIVTSETVLSGGVVNLAIKNTSAANTTVDSGGLLELNGSISAFNTVLSGGTVDLESAKATLTGSLVFAGGGTLEVTGNTSAGSGDLAVISGFSSGSVIDIAAATTIGAATTVSFTTAVSSGNTVVTISGGGATDSFVFAGTAIGPTLALFSDNSGGHELAISGTVSAVTSVGNGSSATDVVVSSGAPLTVYNGGTIINATILSGGTATISAGGVDSGATVAAGGSETLRGAATGDVIFGAQNLDAGTAVATNETISSGGAVTAAAAGATVSGATVSSGATLTLSGGATAVNTTIAGGTVNLLTPADTLSGTLSFDGPGTLDLAAIGAAGAGDQAVISGFYTGDVVDLAAIGAGATSTITTSGGNTIATVTSGGVSQSVVFAGSVTSNLTISATSGGAEQISYAGPPTTTSYTPGDLVLSIYGNGAGTGAVTLDQAAPITLEEITSTGQIVSIQELPQTTTVVNGVTEYAISGEYESASEGLLTLSADGRSLTILGYGVTASAFDAADAEQVYGTTALGQTTSIPSGTITAVPRIVADISYNGSVDTSTSLTGIFNTNNPRSVYTINGTTFYLSGQGNGTDGTEGVFLADDGASGATPIYNTTTDTREVFIYNAQLYVSVDSKSNGGGGVYNFGASLPVTQTAPSVLPGIGHAITLTAAQANSVNASAVGTSVNLSPEQYFFANATTLYIADGGDPKEGGLGDGGLQKWSLVNGTWTLDYTLSQGLNQVPDTDADGTTGLVGLTGTVEGGNVILYASNETVAETDQTYLYTITDPLAQTTAPTNESFTLLDTAAPGTLIRGVAFAPTSAFTMPVVSTTLTISAATSSGGLTVTNGGSLIVRNGGTIAGTTLLSGGGATVSSGGFDSATFVAHGANELVLGSAAFDIIDGTQTVSGGTAVVSGEIVENGGSLDLFIKGAIASGTTVNTGGALNINGNAFAVNTVISGGTVALESPKAVVSGALFFSGTSGTVERTVVATSGLGVQATISGFGATDAIDERVFGSGSLATTVLSGGNVVATVTSGGTSESFTFAGSATVTGSAYASGLSLQSDNSGGVELIYTPPPPVVIIVSGAPGSSGLSIGAGSIISVLSGGVMSGITILNGGSAVIAPGGEDFGTTILAGGTEVVSGDANGDQIYGLQNVTSGPSGATSPATVENETVFNGGTLELYLKPDVATNITVSSGGQFLLSGNVSATDTTLEAGATMALQSPKAVINGGLTFVGPATVDFTGVTSSGFGAVSATISGFAPGDVIDEPNIATSGFTVVTSGGNTVATLTGGTTPYAFTFAGTAISENLAEIPDATTGYEIVDEAACFARGTLIRAEAGEVLVEDLRAGDRVVTQDGRLEPVVWIGRRRLRPRLHPTPAHAHPIRVRAGAFGPEMPRRDLFVSPEHAIFTHDVLIPARCLVNGGSIAQAEVDEIVYYHIELARHDVVFAENLPAETWLDTGSRRAFDNAAVVDIHPVFDPGAAARAWRELAYAPLVEHGPMLARVRAGLAGRAAALGLAVSELRVDVTAPGPVTVAVPAGTSRVVIAAPAGRVAGGDARVLGCAIKGVHLDGTRLAPDDKRLAGGFHAVEGEGDDAWRWTDGAGALELGADATARVLDFTVIALAAVAREIAAAA